MIDDMINDHMVNIKYSVPDMTDDELSRIKTEFESRSILLPQISRSLELIARITKDKYAVNGIIALLVDFRDDSALIRDTLFSIEEITKRTYTNPQTKNYLNFINKYKTTNPNLVNEIIKENLVDWSVGTKSYEIIENNIAIINSKEMETLIENFDDLTAKLIIKSVLRVNKHSKNKELAEKLLSSCITEECKEVMNHYKQHKNEIIEKLYLLGVREYLSDKVNSIIEILNQYKTDPERKNIAIELVTKMNSFSGHYLNAEMEFVEQLGAQEFFEEKYFEVRKYLEKNDVKKELLEKMTSAFKEEKEYIKKQKEQNMLPLAVIFGENPEYISKVKKLSDLEKDKLGIAWSIAYQNVDPSTEENYLDAFYSGMRKTLDEDYEHLTDWCETIIDGLAKVAETGQSLDEVMGR
ncbi:hypothetical protein HOK51_03175 [Candidatus Woesearchaeota archaeon]|jgi:hypothetical protein|nr:hypothetical protein [Candidatus Woesearchaeota archaeon]MBT6518821.1 hypothetical protein [Candidatus Woesearchaeota archaeon]MBT7367960.1 hypothetical protein [Candidatus Woesearchaeota archaeon]